MKQDIKEQIIKLIEDRRVIQTGLIDYNELQYVFNKYGKIKNYIKFEDLEMMTFEVDDELCKYYIKANHLEGFGLNNGIYRKLWEIGELGKCGEVNYKIVEYFEQLGYTKIRPYNERVHVEY